MERVKLPDATDKINNPKHYTSHPSGIECIDITRHMGFNLGNVIKYVWRADLKEGIDDLKKAVWYLQDEIKKREATLLPGEYFGDENFGIKRSPRVEIKRTNHDITYIGNTTITPVDGTPQSTPHPERVYGAPSTDSLQRSTGESLSDAHDAMGRAATAQWQGS